MLTRKYSWSLIFFNNQLTLITDETNSIYPIYLYCNGNRRIIRLGQTANVQVIHNSADPAAAVVDIYVQFNHDEVKLDNVAFRTATPFLELPSGVPINIIISPAESQSSEEQIKSFPDIKLKHGEDYHVIANGVVSEEGFESNPDHKKTDFNLFILPGRE